MSAAPLQHWALVNARGEVVAQVVTDGRTPHEDGSHKGRRLREVRTDRRGDPRFERLDPDTGAWTTDEAARTATERRARFDQASPAEREAEREARWADRLAALEARVARLEGGQ